MNRLADIKPPVIFAHRGASAYAPENTLAAFKLAKEHGADAIELDVKLTKDKKAVVIHDQTVDRTTNGTGHIHSLTLREIKELDAGSFFSPQFKGEQIPTLAQVFEVVGNNLFINIELTNYLTPFDELPQIVAGLVKEYQQEDNVLFSSFRPFTLIRIKRLLPQIPVAILPSSGTLGLIARSSLGRWVSPQIIHPNIVDCSVSFVRKQKRLNRRVHVWTVNGSEDIQNLFKLSVEGIISDDPRLARQLRESL